MSIAAATVYRNNAAYRPFRQALKCEKAQKLRGFRANRTYRHCIKDSVLIDICCGTGAFLITSLNRIKSNIQAESISDEKKKGRIEEAQKNSLIGVERDASMYALAYANMRFHGDGKSNLFNCSSLLIDSYAPVDESGETFVDDCKVPLHEAIKEYGDIDIGMINPPYHRVDDLLRSW